MARIKLLEGNQRDSLLSIKQTLNLDWDEVGRLCGVCGRTVRDWQREKYLIQYSALKKLCNLAGIKLPHGQLLPEYWSTKKAARLGAKSRYRLFGNPGTLEGRSKGGLVSSGNFHSNPEYARRLNFKVRKRIERPKENASLAEFAGILLGDGGVRGDHQITVSFNIETDNAFSIFVRRLLRKLFGIGSSIYYREGTKGADIVISSKNLVEFLAKKNILKQGNKISNQVDIPEWIKVNKNYRTACLRGLMDTDGGVYCHRYIINKRWYKYPRLSFTSVSAPLLSSAEGILRDLNFNPKKKQDSITLYRLPEIKRYFKEIGTHNPKHLERYKAFCAEYK